MKFIILLAAVACSMYAMAGGQPPAASIKALGSCPPNDAFPHDGYWYQFFDCPMNWSQAEATCKNRMIVKGRQMSGGHLVSILNQEEQDWVKFQIDMRYGSKVGIWLGIKRAPHHQNSCPDSFVWTDGKQVVYKNFLNGQPNCRWPDEDCLHLIDNFHWNDAECGVHMRFLCKLKLLNFEVNEEIGGEQLPSTLPPTPPKED
jgi:hypothetical protein